MGSSWVSCKFFYYYIAHQWLRNKLSKHWYVGMSEVMPQNLCLAYGTRLFWWMFIPGGD